LVFGYKAMNSCRTHHSRSAAVGLVVGFVGIAASAQDVTNAPPQTAPWEKSAALGLTLTRGNSDTLLFTGNVLASRKGKQHEISLGADATYGENNDVKNAESLHGFAQYNRLFTDRFYGYARLDGLHDSISDLQYRLTFGPGAGYYFLKDQRTRLSAEAGPGLIHEKLGGQTKTYLTLRVAERLEHKLNDTVHIWQSLEFLPQVDDFNNYIVNAEAGIESALTKKLSLRTYVQDTYDNVPASGRKKNDVKLVSAIAYKF
jgi:putative salt-induced outer membrane protein YdiY